jgi:hypothetical protein
MFEGLDSFAVLGASANPKISGLGFRYVVDERWPFTNPTGLAGVMKVFVRNIIQICTLLLKQSRNENSDRVDHSTVIHPVPGRIQEKCVPQLRCIAKNLKHALYFKPNISLTALGNFQELYRQCLFLCIFRHSFWIWNYMINSTNPGFT